VERTEWRDGTGRWYRSYGNELWEFADNGLMRRREASINDVEIDAAERRFVGADWQMAELPLR
jgi:nuclear transport factor 2 (NTF2) superfamily protein